MTDFGSMVEKNVIYTLKKTQKGAIFKRLTHFNTNLNNFFYKNI